MDRILYCITLEHDWRWTLAAGLICAIGVGAAIHLLTRAAMKAGPERRKRLLLGGSVGGLAAFATHFMAMQGYQAGGEVRYGLWLTIASLIIVVAGVGLACLIVGSRPGRVARGIGAMVGLAAVAAMHFTGMAALQLPGRVVWDPAMVALSLAAGLSLAGLTGALVSGRGPHRLMASTLGGVLAIVCLHFIAMSAMTIDPRAVSDIGPTVSGVVMTGVLTAIIAGIGGLAACLIWMDWAARTNALSQIREAVEAMPDGIAVYDASDRLVLWNTRYSQVNPELSSNLQAGMSFRDIVQIGLNDRLYADAVGREAEWAEERMAARAQPSNAIEQRIAGDRWIRVSDRRTAAGGIVTVCIDITDLKNDARALAEARDAAQSANSAKSQFLANMSHEIRTPLNGVIGLAQAMARTELSEPQREMLELIQSSGQTLQVLLSDILDLARVESGRLELASEPFDLGRAVRDAAQLYEAAAREKGLQFFVDIAPDADRWVEGDLVRLKQILTNLVSNAVKFTSQGFVSLTASGGPDRDGRGTLRFTVEDTGIGFDCATRERLFSRFEQADGGITRRFGGSGLGLAISRQLAEMMGGELDCESEPGGGSAFILTIPFVGAEAPATAAPTDERDHAGAAALRILVADDHPVNRKVVEMILAQVGAELTMAENGVEALHACRESDFDLILMDMQMPVMDGLTATREIRLHEAALGLDRTPIVMLTANALAEHIAATEAAGADRHLAKPFEAADLLGLLDALPRRPAASIAA